MNSLRSCLLILVAVSLVSAAAPKANKPTAAPLLNDAGPGSVSGQFLLEGAVPAPKILVKKGDPAAKDGTVCAAVDLVSDSLVVDPKTKGIRHIFVYIRKIDKAKTKIHPKLVAGAKKDVVFDQKGCRFTPHTLLLRTGQSVVVKSADNCAHNTHTYPIRNKADNFIINANNRTGLKFKYPVAEFLPTTVKCDIHPWMTCYLFVTDHPFSATTDAQGNFSIKGLAPGKYSIEIWHEKLGKAKASVTIAEDGSSEAVEVKMAEKKKSSGRRRRR